MLFESMCASGSGKPWGKVQSVLHVQCHMVLADQSSAHGGTPASMVVPFESPAWCWLGPIMSHKGGINQKGWDFFFHLIIRGITQEARDFLLI
jgi:hypothetical protein